MTYEVGSLDNNGPHCYGAEPVSEVLMFAHVLNVPVSEELWPGDAIELFFQSYFAMRLVGDDEHYVREDAVAEHMRSEILRLCGDHSWTLEDACLARFKFDCYCFDGSYAEELFGDGSADGFYEPDILNSELFLTVERISPESAGSNAVQAHVEYYDQFYDNLSPQHRVEPIQPTESED